jgi:hypothetical protein
VSTNNATIAPAIFCWGFESFMRNSSLRPLLTFVLGLFAILFAQPRAAQSQQAQSRSIVVNLNDTTLMNSSDIVFVKLMRNRGSN